LTKTELRSEFQDPLINAYERIKDLEYRVDACESVEQRAEKCTSALETDVKHQAQRLDSEPWNSVGLCGSSFEERNRKTKRQNGIRKSNCYGCLHAGLVFSANEEGYAAQRI